MPHTNPMCHPGNKNFLFHHSTPNTKPSNTCTIIHQTIQVALILFFMHHLGPWHLLLTSSRMQGVPEFLSFEGHLSKSCQRLQPFPSPIPLSLSLRLISHLFIYLFILFFGIHPYPLSPLVDHFLRQSPYLAGVGNLAKKSKE